MQTSRPRKPRFVRVGEPDPLKLTPRDLRILSEVACHRFMQSHHLVRLLGGSRQHLVRRLGRLYHAGLLDRPKWQRLLQGGYCASLTYCLTSAGRQVLEREQPERLPPVPRLRGAASVLSLSHSLRVTDVLVAVQQVASSQQADFFLLPNADIVQPVTDRSPEWRLCWSLGTRRSKTAWVIPDGAFALRTEEDKAAFFILEVDRGTMPVTRSRSGQSSFQKKIELYKETRHQGVLWKRFGIPAFRVLIVAESAKRLASIQQATVRLFTRGESEMFLFAVTSQVVGKRPLDGWRTCGGKERRLLS